MMGSNGWFSVLLAALTATAWLSATPPEEAELTVGWQKQLFLDDWVVDSTQNVSRVLKEAATLAGKPGDHRRQTLGEVDRLPEWSWNPLRR